jgi:hypothetical protein
VELSETGRERQHRQLPSLANAERADGLPRAKRERAASRRTRERRRKEHAQ